MRINHLFVSSTDVEKSAKFYCEFLGFTISKKFNDGGGDSQIVHKELNGIDLDLLIVPTGTAKLLAASHIAFEVESANEFDELFKNANVLGLKPRSDVPLESHEGVSTFSMYGRTYRHFYVLDPSWVNIEIMWKADQSNP